MENLKKDIFEMENEELTSFIAKQENYNLALDILKTLEEQMMNEIERVEHYLSELANRSGILIMLSGLVSLFSLGARVDDVFTKQYLLYVFPFLIMAIISFHFSSKRVSKRILNFFAGGTKEDYILWLRARVSSIEKIGKDLNTNFNKVLPMHKWTRIFVYSFLLSFIVHFYSYIFAEPLNWCFSIILSFLILILGLVYFLKGKPSAYTEKYPTGIDRNKNYYTSIRGSDSE